MTRFSPKIVIIDHFDNLINRVDIDIDDCLKKYTDQQHLRQLLISRGFFSEKTCQYSFIFHANMDLPKPKHIEDRDLWSESTKIIDYLNQLRMRTIQELRKAQEDNLEFYKLNLSRFKSELNNAQDIVEVENKLFAENFYFQVYFRQSEKKSWSFNLFTFVTDFYLSPSQIDSLE